MNKKDEEYYCMGHNTSLPLILGILIIFLVILVEFLSDIKEGENMYRTYILKTSSSWGIVIPIIVMIIGTIILYKTIKYIIRTFVEDKTKKFSNKNKK